MPLTNRVLPAASLRHAWSAVSGVALGSVVRRLGVATAGAAPAVRAAAAATPAVTPNMVRRDMPAPSVLITQRDYYRPFECNPDEWDIHAHTGM